MGHPVCGLAGAEFAGLAEAVFGVVRLVEGVDEVHVAGGDELVFDEDGGGDRLFLEDGEG